MSMRYPGGLIATSPVNAAYPSGVWTQAQAIPYQSQNVWTRDQYWPYTTLLLQGNGTNGAQNNTFLDSSTNNFTITRNGNTTQGSFTPYEANGYWSNYFDGSGDYLQLADSTAWDLTGDYTIEMWLYKTSSSSQTFFMLGSGGSTSILLYQNASNSIIFLTSSAVITASTAAPLNQWNHLALVRSGGGSNNTVMYLNGVNVGQATNTASFTGDASNGLRIGAEYPTGFEYTGYISNVRVVKGTAVYTSAFTPSTAPLTAITNTSLLTCQSNRFLDNSTNAFTITRNGDTSVQAFQPFPGQTTYSTSVLGGSGYFDGSGDYLTATLTSQAPGTGDFTYQFWVYQPTAAAICLFDTRAVNNNTTGFALLINGSRQLAIYTNGTVLTGSGSVAAGSWAFVTVARSGSTLTIYLNGTSQGTVTFTNNLTDTALRLAQYVDGTGTFTGYIADFKYVKGSADSATNPTSPQTATSGTQFLASFTNAGISDAAMMNDLETVGNAQVSTSVVKYGTGSMAFDGNGDYLYLNNTRLLTFNGSSTFTVEGWFYQTAYVSASGYMNNVLGDLTPTTATALYWSIGMNASNQPGIRWYDGAVKTADASTALTLNTWNHVAWVVTAGVVRIFINGVQATLTGTTTLTTPSTTLGYLIIGADRGYYMTGNIDDLRISAGVARYITNFTPPPARMPGQ